MLRPRRASDGAPVSRQAPDCDLAARDAMLERAGQVPHTAGEWSHAEHPAAIC